MRPSRDADRWDAPAASTSVRLDDILSEICTLIDIQTSMQQDVQSTLAIVSGLAGRAAVAPRVYQRPSAMSAMGGVPSSVVPKAGGQSEWYTGLGQHTAVQPLRYSQAGGCSTTSSMNSQFNKGEGLALPRAWPTCLRMRKGLEEEQVHTRERIKTIFNKRSKVSMKQASRISTARTAPQSSTVWRPVYRTQDPSSMAVITFDMLSLASLFHDLLITPYSLAWDMEFGGALMIMTLVSALYWTLGILVKFRTGYYLHGELHLAPRDIAWHYAKTSLLFDLALVVVDWAIIAASLGDADATGSYRGSKVFRIMKVLRLARVMELLERMVASLLPSNRLVLRLLQVILGTLIFTHLMCCAWYALGQRNSSDTDMFWIDGLFQPGGIAGETDRLGNGPLYAESGDTFRYLTSFHWTLAQITLGAISIEPTNSMERVFCIVLLMTGVLFNAVIVSLISSQTMEYVAMRQEQLEMASTLRRFLEQNHVDMPLQVRVRRQIRQRLAKSRMLLSENDVPALGMLSAALRTELLFEVRIPNLLTHPLFRMWTQIDYYALRAVCDDAVRLISNKPQDYIFVAGQVAANAYYVIQGTLRYAQDSETSFEEVETVTSVEKGSWISEMALWAHWLHVGKLEADTPCLMLMVSATEFLTVLPRHPLVGYLTRYYGRAYFVRISAAKPPHSKWPNDLKVPHTEASDLLSPDVGLELLERESRLGNLDLSKSDLAKLAEEIKSERCAIQMGHGGELERIVAVSAIKIIREDDGRVLMELARKGKDDRVAVVCGLPAMKRSRGELPALSLERLFKEVLSPFVPALRLTGSEDDVDVKNSHTTHLLTKYLRTVHFALLRADIPVASLSQAVAKEELVLLADYADYLEELRDNPIYALQCGDKTRFLCFVSPDTYSWVTGMGEEAEAMLRDWLESLSCDNPTKASDYAKTSFTTGFLSEEPSGSEPVMADSPRSSFGRPPPRAFTRSVSFETHNGRFQFQRPQRASAADRSSQRTTLTFGTEGEVEGVDVLTVPPDHVFAVRV